MSDKPAYFVQSTGPGGNLCVGNGFGGNVHVHGRWENIDIHGGNVTIGGEKAAVRAAFGFSLTEPLPAAAYKLGDLLILFGTDSATFQLEIGRTHKRRITKKHR